MKTICALATLLFALLVCSSPFYAQVPTEPIRQEPVENRAVQDFPHEGVIGSIEFIGLRRIPATTLRTKLTSKIGDTVSAERITADVRALEATGWLDAVSVELEEIPVLLALAATGGAADAARIGLPVQSAAPMKLIFVVEERPFLAKVEFRGGRILTRERIRDVLTAKHLALKTAAPCNRTELWRAARALEAVLGELGHPLAKVRVRLTEVPTAAVRAAFLIDEGPRVEVGKVQFTGNDSFDDTELQRQMKEISPRTFLADWRDKNIFTHERLEKDMERVRQFYRNRGYVEAQTGDAEVKFVEGRARRWWPWPGTMKKQSIELTIPVREGPAYRMEGTNVEGASDAVREKLAPLLAQLSAPAAYSEERILRAKEVLSKAEWTIRSPAKQPKAEVETRSKIDREAGTVRVEFRVREAAPIVVRRIEFTGHQRFSDAYYRRRIPLKEGEPFDADKVFRGLEQLARTGFVRPVTADDLKVKLDEAARAADVTIHVEEIGRQKISLNGGGVGLGSSLGLAYNIFNLLGGEEILTARIDGGPENLQIVLGIARDYLFGSRATLGINVFRNVVQPRLQGRRLYSSRSHGLIAAWDYPLSRQDTLGVNYEISKNSMSVPLEIPVQLPGLVVHQVRSLSSRSALDLSWTRELPARRIDVTAGMAGGWLGGTEKSVRTSLTAARLQADPLSGRRNSWAFRGHLSGTSSFCGATLPFSARSFAGEELLRGFRRGELGPMVIVRQQAANGSTVYATEAGGANAALAINNEYRVPVESHTEVAAFFDAGSAWLVPRWLGGTRPEILSGTNGVLRGSAGIELRVRVPLIEQTLRVNYAMNPWRLARAIALPDGAQLRPTDRRAAFGWALGTLF